MLGRFIIIIIIIIRVCVFVSSSGNLVRELNVDILIILQGDTEIDRLDEYSIKDNMSRYLYVLRAVIAQSV
jgi:hypothetical protein